MLNHLIWNSRNTFHLKLLVILHLLLNFSLEIISRKKHSPFSLGFIPTVFLPGITATLADVELVFLAKSSDRFIILETLTPAAGSNSYKLTTGPLFIFLFHHLFQNLAIFLHKFCIWSVIIKIFRR